jgi:hypothetical protein
LDNHRGKRNHQWRHSRDNNDGDRHNAGAVQHLQLPLPVTFTLLDASTDYSDPISTETGYAPLVADTNPANGLSDGVDKMPSFLSTAKVLDDDADGAVDEDPLDAADNDGDGRIDEDRAPLARLFAQTYPPHATQILNVMIYSPVPLDNDGDLVQGEDPPGDNPPLTGNPDDDGDSRVDEDPPEGTRPTSSWATRRSARW